MCTIKRLVLCVALLSTSVVSANGLRLGDKLDPREDAEHQIKKGALLADAATTRLEEGGATRRLNFSLDIARREMTASVPSPRRSRDRTPPRATTYAGNSLVDYSRRLVRRAPKTRPKGPARRWEEGRAQDHVGRRQGDHHHISDIQNHGQYIM